MIEIGSKTAEKNSAQTNKQTNQQTLGKKGHLAVNQQEHTIHLSLTIYYKCKKLNSLKHRVRSQITRIKLQKSFCDLEHGVLL